MPTLLGAEESIRGDASLYFRIIACAMPFTLGANMLSAAIRCAGDTRTIFLRIIIAWNPECRMIAGHSKLRMFFFYNEVIQILLLRELIAEPQAIIIKTKTNNQITILRLLILHPAGPDQRRAAHQRLRV